MTDKSSTPCELAAAPGSDLCPHCGSNDVFSWVRYYGLNGDKRTAMKYMGNKCRKCQKHFDTYPKPTPEQQAIANKLIGTVFRGEQLTPERITLLDRLCPTCHGSGNLYRTASGHLSNYCHDCKGTGSANAKADAREATK